MNDELTHTILPVGKPIRFTTGRWIPPAEREQERQARIGELEDISLIISKDGNALKVEADDSTNETIKSTSMENLNVAGNIGQHTATPDLISNVIGNIVGIFKGVIDTIGGLI
ncbi:hypothetical protein ES702_07293 [subsurface metagenome]